jgi:AcrR family transcriptional regulator
MARKSRNSTPPDSLRQSILDAALKVFADKGYGAATIKDIAAEAGVAAGTIYNYAGGKRDLFIQAMRRLILSQPVMSFINGESPGSIEQAVADRLDFVLSCSQTPLVSVISEVLREPI